MQFFSFFGLHLSLSTIMAITPLLVDQIEKFEWKLSKCLFLKYHWKILFMDANSTAFFILRWGPEGTTWIWRSIRIKYFYVFFYTCYTGRFLQHNFIWLDDSGGHEVVSSGVRSENPDREANISRSDQSIYNLKHSQDKLNFPVLAEVLRTGPGKLTHIAFNQRHWLHSAQET